MRDPKQIPVVNIVDPVKETDFANLSDLSGPLVGPGSQQSPDGGAIEYMPMPTSMDTFVQPQIPEPDEVDNVGPAIELLQQCVDALKRCAANDRGQQFNLQNLTPENQELINQLMGVGEVSITIDREPKVVIQESVMAGVWRVQSLDEDGVVDDLIEVGKVPEIVVETAFQNARPVVDTREDDMPQGTINSPSILVELADIGKAYRRGQPAHVVNLSLLPVSAEDLFTLGERLGVGPVTILSRGYGNCRIGSTGCDNVWWIKYYNSEDALILNTIEVVDIPEVGIAAPEDIADSAERLAEILEIYQ